VNPIKQRQENVAFFFFQKIALSISIFSGNRLFIELATRWVVLPGISLVTRAAGSGWSSSDIKDFLSDSSYELGQEGIRCIGN
jgi:hypothetical protein